MENEKLKVRNQFSVPVIYQYTDDDFKELDTSFIKHISRKKHENEERQKIRKIFNFVMKIASYVFFSLVTILSMLVIYFFICVVVYALEVI